MHLKWLEIALLVTSLSFENPFPRNPNKHTRKNLIVHRLKVESMVYISAAVSMHLSSFNTLTANFPIGSTRKAPPDANDPMEWTDLFSS